MAKPNTLTPESILKNDGINFVLTRAYDDPSKLDPSMLGGAGDEDLAGIAHATLDLFGKTDERKIRVVIGDLAVHAMRDDLGCIALVVIKGHPIIKSAQRLQRLALRRMQATEGQPKPASQPEPANTEPMHAAV